jgi:opacity protein-like surface antigen
MRKLLLATTAALAFAATPALAKDGSPYVGIEGGVTFPQSQDVNGWVTYTTPTGTTTTTTTTVGRAKYKTGYDVDLIGGYDLGMFRLEGELGYKHARVKSYNLNSAFLTGINTTSGNTFTTNSFNLRNNASVYSAMINGLADFGGNNGIGAYAGAGLGYANVKELGGSHGGFAWQAIAGLYYPVSSNIDVGLKYRYFNGPRVNRTDAVAFTTGATTCGTVPCEGGTAFFNTGSHYRSHSLLASLVYNFAGSEAAPPPPPPPPAPPPPPPPATTTCPDGTVVTAGTACPVPPPPPPPPPPAPVKGERG